MKKKIFLTLPILLTTLVIPGCEKDDGTFKYEPLKKEIIDDKYRNMYQIFPISFADSDGNGKGDLNGIKAKLDYLEDMNYTGVWLNPIGPSSTPHHYDVEDYCAVSPEFGTMEDFDALVSDLHSRNMTIILDLVINHSSSNHVWFENSYIAARAKKERDPDYLKYNWVQLLSSSAPVPSGYQKVSPNDKCAYEARFDKTMPDLNLEQVISDPNGDLATELKNIFKFWLVDHNIDGFRLDAVTSYFTNSTDKNLEMLTFINDECRKLKPDCYIVGEASWGTAASENKKYQESGIDSFFQFGNCAKNTGYITTTVVQQKATRIYDGLIANRDNANGGIEAPFLDNHDVGRYVGAVSREAPSVKFTLALFQQMAGATFTYYGDELGMGSQSSTTDGWFRLPIRWGDSYTCDLAKLKLYGATNPSLLKEELSYPFGDAATQLADPNSIANFVKKANLARLAFPEIARGSAELVESPDSSFAVIKREWNNNVTYVAINASKAFSHSFDYSPYGSKVVFELSASNPITQQDRNKPIINIPAQSIVFIK